MWKKVIEQYHKLPVPLKATAWSILCIFMQKGISLVTTPLFTRLLPTAEYGRISVFSSWESILILLVTLSTGKAVFKLCSKYENNNALESTLTGLNITLALIAGALIGCFIKQILALTGLTPALVLCLYLFCAFQSIIASWTLMNQYKYAYKIVVLETLVFYVAATCGGLIGVIFISRTAESRIVPQAATAVVIGMVIIISTFKKSHKWFDIGIWKYTLCFCIPLLPHYLSEIVLLNSDRIMINSLCGPSDTAIYSIAYAVGSLITVLTGAINSAFGPYQYHKIQDGEYEALAKNTNYIIGFVALCLAGIMLFSREIVLIFGGSKYSESISLIIPISLGVFFNYVFQLFARVQEYFDQKYTIVIASTSCAALNILLNYIYIRRYGYKAAAYTTFACYFLFCLLHYVFYRIACRKNIQREIYDVKGLIAISVALFAAAFVTKLISRLYILKYTLLVISIALLVLKRKKIIRFVTMMRQAK